MKKSIFLLFTILFFVTACQQKEASNEIKVGTIAGPETQLMQVAKKVALKQYGLRIKIVTFSDYIMPNTALSEGDIDANMFQHAPYLDQAIKARGYKIVSIGKTFVYPMGIYSKKITNFSQLKVGDIIAVPNDPSNEARALLLLQKAGVIQLKPGATINATILDIAKNPKQLKFKELDAADLSRALPDVTAAAITDTYAIPAGLMPTKDAIYLEGKDSPYANIVAVRIVDKNNPKLKELVEALHSKAVLQAAKKIFKGNAIPAF